MSERGSRKGRRLSSDEHSLWEHVVRSIKPLRKQAAKARSEPSAEPEKPKASVLRVKKTVSIAVPAPLPKPKSPPSLAPIDKRTKQKIARGRSEIDGRLDLHGYTQAEAHTALLRFLRSSQMKGGRVVLVITGKGKRGEHGREAGVLRRQVPQWLALAEFREYVVGFDEAALGHGGEGALYVRLRKQRA